MNYGSGFTGGEWECGPCNHIIPILLKLSSRLSPCGELGWSECPVTLPRLRLVPMWNGLGLEATRDNIQRR